MNTTYKYTFLSILRYKLEYFDHLPTLVLILWHNNVVLIFTIMLFSILYKAMEYLHTTYYLIPPINNSKRPIYVYKKNCYMVSNR